MSGSQRLSIQHLRGSCIDQQTASGGLDRFASDHPNASVLAAATDLLWQWESRPVLKAEKFSSSTTRAHSSGAEPSTERSAASRSLTTPLTSWLADSSSLAPPQCSKRTGLSTILVETGPNSGITLLPLTCTAETFLLRSSGVTFPMMDHGS